MAAATAPAPIDSSSCDVTVYRAATGELQTFTLRVGGVLRIGRGGANDIVLDFLGVSVFHAELHLRAGQVFEDGTTGPPILCVRDESKNAVGVRPGPHAREADVQKPVPAWECLQQGALRVLEHGWQMILPLRSRKENSQLPEAWRVLTVYIGTKIGPLLNDEEIDGEIWEPSMAMAPELALKGGVPLKALPKTSHGAAKLEAGTVAFEDAPIRGGKSGPSASQPGHEDSPEQRKREKEERKRERKDRREREKRERIQAEVMREREAKEREDRKREKKAKKAAKKARDVSEDQDADIRREQEEVEAKERERLERKREKKERKKKQKDDEDPNEADEGKKSDEDGGKPSRTRKHSNSDRQSKDQPESNEDKAVSARDREARERVAYLAELDRARREREEREKLDQDGDGDLRKKEREERERLERELEDELAEELVPVKKKTDEMVGAQMTREGVQENLGRKIEGNQSDALTSTVSPEGAGASLKVLAGVEITGGQTSAQGVYLRCGSHAGKPVYRMITESQEPSFVYFSDIDKSNTGWIVGAHPTVAGAGSILEFWASPDELPLRATGKHGSILDGFSQIDGNALLALGKLSEETQKQLRADYHDAVASSVVTASVHDAASAKRGVPEEEASETIADAATSTPAAQSVGGADARANVTPGEEGMPGSVSSFAGALTPQLAAFTPSMGAVTPGALSQAAATPQPQSTGVAVAPSSPAPLALLAATLTPPPSQPLTPTIADASKAVAAIAASTPISEAEGATATAAATPLPHPVEATRGAENSADATVAAADVDRPRSPSLPSRGASQTPARTEPTAGGTMAPRTEAGFSDAGAPTERVAVDEAGGGLTAAALAAHSKVMPPIGGHVAGQTDGRSAAGARSGVAVSAIAPSAVAPSIAPTVRTFRTHVTKGEEKRAGGLTAAALAAHSEAMPPIGGIAADAGAAGDAKTGGAEFKSVAGKSFVAQSEVTFRTHMTTRSLLVGASVMRELMRSVSPISEPGVNIRRRKRPHSGMPDVSEPLSGRPILSETQSPERHRKKKKKKDKKEKGKASGEKASSTKKKAKAAAGHPSKAGTRMVASASHWRNSSPTPFSNTADASATPVGQRQEPSAAPSHWKGPSATPAMQPSESVDPPLVAARPTKKQRLPKLIQRDQRLAPSPCSPRSISVEVAARAKVRLKKRSRDGVDDRGRSPGGGTPCVEGSVAANHGSARPKKRPKDGKERDVDAKKRKRSLSKGRRRKRSP